MIYGKGGGELELVNRFHMSRGKVCATMRQGGEGGSLLQAFMDMVKEALLLFE